MIRINLLGAPKPKKGKKAAAVPSVPTFSEGPNIFLVLLVVLLITAVANGFWYLKLQRDADKIKQDMAKAEIENHRLSEVKTRYLEREKEKNDYKRRVDVIDQLRGAQSGPVTLLATISNTVNSTDAVWLSTMSEDGPNVNIKGVALSVQSIADLMRNLKNTGYFKNIEIKESFQDDTVKDMQAYVFTLVCERNKS
jgi:type IV pilus assembly protein PilN